MQRSTSTAVLRHFAGMSRRYRRVRLTDEQRALNAALVAMLTRDGAAT